jgi:hypothetical protein
MTSEVKVKKMKKMLALISRTNDIICMLDVNMMVAKLRAMLKLFETDRQTYLFKNAKSDIRKVFLNIFVQTKNLSQNTQKWTDQI